MRHIHHLAMALMLWGGLSAQAAPVAEESAHPSQPQVIESMLRYNQQFVSSHDHDYFVGHQQTQHPHITLLGCSDSRASAASFTADPTDRVFSIRNIGNQLQNSFGSVDYGVHHLKTPILLVLGHTHCGAVQAALGDYQSESFAVIRELDHLALPLQGLNRGQRQSDFEQIWLQGVERNVDYQVKTAIKRYQQEVAQGKLVVVGAVYDFINAYGSGEGRLIVVNINGEHKLEKLYQHPVLNSIPAPLKGQVVKRIQ